MPKPHELVLLTMTLLKIALNCLLVSGGAYCNTTETLQVDKRSRSRCVSAGSDGPKRWGPGCYLACQCKYNMQCTDSGHCPGECRRGWIRISETSPCFKQSLKSDNLDDSVRNKDRDPYHKFRHKDNIHSSTRLIDSSGFAAYSFSSTLRCIPGSREHVLELELVINSSTPLIISYIYIHPHIFFPYDFIYAVAFFYVNESTVPIVHDIPREVHHKVTEDIFLKRFPAFVLFDRLRIVFHVLSMDSSCTGNEGNAMVVAYAFPVCPYRRWGVYCEHICRCPCSIRECHPLTGSCFPPPRICPDGTYGQRCDLQCSLSCIAEQNRRGDHDNFTDLKRGQNTFLKGHLRSGGGGKKPHHRLDGLKPICHPVSGICRECANSDQTGSTCDVYLDHKEFGYILSHCREERGLWRIFTRHFPHNFSVGYFSFDEGLQEGYSLRGKIALMIIFLVVLFFLLGFITYVVCLRVIARRKLRGYMERLDRQRMMRTSIRSWSELREEFREYHAGSLTFPLQLLKSTTTRPSTDDGLGDPSYRLAPTLSDSEVDPGGYNLSVDYPTAMSKKVSFKGI